MMCIACQEREAHARKRCMRCYQRTRRAQQRWTEAERVIVRSEVGITAMPALARKLGRTIRAVSNEAERHGLYVEAVAKRSAGLSFSDVCHYLGIDHKSLYRWLSSGAIAAEKRDVTVHDGCRREVWTFSYDAVETFLRSGGALYVMRPIDGWREIYDAARHALLQRYIARSEVKRMLYISDGAMQHYLEQGFPQARLTGTRGACYYERAAVRAWLDAHPRHWTRAARAAMGEG